MYIIAVDNSHSTMPHQIDGRYIETTAKHMGLEFKRETNMRRYTAHNNATGTWPNIDKDIVYLFEPGMPTHFGAHNTDSTDGLCDAVLHYNDKIHHLSWDDCSKATIRKTLLRTSEEPECAVCYEECPMGCHVCRKCNGNLCPLCRMKMCLTPGTIDLVLRGEHITVGQCVQCRVMCHIDLQRTSYMLFDRLNEFTERQQEALVFLKNSDPEFETNMKMWKAMSEEKKTEKIKRFRAGCRVKIHGLKNARKWNGKTAEIIGAKVIKNEVIRWPVLLSDESHSKALLKGINMKKI